VANIGRYGNPAQFTAGEQVGDDGVEPVTILPQETSLSQQGGAESGALFGDDERLRLLLEAWAELPESVKTAVLEMVRGYSSSSGGS
jgi:hypothetical protein